MRKHAFFTLVSICSALSLAGCSAEAPPDDTGQGDGGVDGGRAADAGPGVDGGSCASPADCPTPAGECSRATCTAGHCGTSPVADGTAIAMQTAGDCTSVVCDGHGAMRTQADATDAPNDSNPCTSDVCTGTTPSHPPVSAGTSCGTGLTCDASGHCMGCTMPSDCPAPAACQTSTCTAGMCGTAPSANGTACDDANACTHGEVCQAGACAPGTPVVCTAADACHLAGTCDPTTGTCSSPVAGEGTSCSDGNACTTGDVCTAGVCGGSPLVCPDGTCVAGACLDDVLQRNHHGTRDGLYVQPTFTRAATATLHRDTAFAPAFSGNVYAQPLFVSDGPSHRAVVLVATESNDVYAIHESDGTIAWTRPIGTAPTSTGAGCGNISPVGITGTPVIDLAARTMYLDATTSSASSTIATHMIHALSIDDGTERAGWPVDASSVVSGALTFSPALQNARGALALASGRLYVPYGGHYGDCGAYRGWVVGVPTADPAHPTAWATVARGGGIWAPGGLSTDGSDVFAATGNTFGATTWSDGEAVIRFHGAPTFAGATSDYFTPSNWAALDAGDIDLGGSAPLLVDVPGATPSQLVVAFGKNGVAYLLDRTNLGGVGRGNGTTGEGLASQRVASSVIINTPAAYTTATGTYVVFTTPGSATGIGCPAGQSGNMVALRIGAASPPTLSVAWCANIGGRGSPMVTTTDGHANATVWVVGDTSRRLHGYDGDTGAVVFAGGGATDQVANVQYLQTPIAANGRIYVAGNGALYRFAL